MELFKERDPELYKNFKIEDIKDEIFDMVNPKDKRVLTLSDMIKSGQPEVILGLIIDANQFYEYD